MNRPTQSKKLLAVHAALFFLDALLLLGQPALGLDVLALDVLAPARPTRHTEHASGMFKKGKRAPKSEGKEFEGGKINYFDRNTSLVKTLSAAEKFACRAV